MLLLTGANGRTGRAILSSLVARDVQVRAFVRNPAHADDLLALGAAQIAVGDMASAIDAATAVGGCSTVIHIGPPMAANEVDMTMNFVNAAGDLGVQQFVYYSVMHPLRRAVRHHALKLDATEKLIESDVPYTVIEPIRYMQHLELIWTKVVSDGDFAMPFDVDKKFNVADLADLAEATAVVSTQPGHLYATYELAGPEALSQRDMAAVCAAVLQRDVVAREVALDDMAAAALARGIDPDRVEQMRIMNAHYSAHGFLGNPNVLTWLLGHPPTTFEAYVQRLAEATRPSPG